MKSFGYYYDDKAKQLGAKFGRFFAFSTDQFEAGKLKVKESDAYKQGDKFKSLGGGAFVIARNAKAYLDAVDELISACITERLNDIGLEAIIDFELSNYECYYTGCIDAALGICEMYGATAEQVQERYYKNNKTFYLN